MNIADKRAIKITELSEELEEAKNIIAGFVWPPDDTEEGRQRHLQKVARFAGCTVPQFDQAKPEQAKPEQATYAFRAISIRSD